MRLNGMVPFRIALLALALAATGNGLSQEYCSSENTGSDYSAVFNIYQSNGACFDQCKADYAFAVVQYQNCWCSNYIPADQQTVGDCSQNCPGYPDEQCGDEGAGLYGYVALSIQPSGTLGAASSTQVSSTQASSTPGSSTSSEPVSTTSSPSSTSSTDDLSTEPPSTSSAILPSSTTAVVPILTSTSVAVIVASSTSSPSPGTSGSISRTSPLTYYSSQSSTESPTTQPTSTSQQAPTTTSQQAQTSYVSQIVYQTVTQSPIPSTVVSYVSPIPASTSSSDPPTTFTSSSSSTPSTSYAPTSSSTITPVVAPVPATTAVSSSFVAPSATPSPVTSVKVVTISGAIVTQTVTSTPLVAPQNDPDSTTLQRKSLSGGAIAGVVIGTLFGIAALLFGAFLLWRRRKQGGDAEGAAGAVGAGRGPNNFKRNASVLSKTGLLSRGRPVSVTEKDAEEPLYVNTNTGNNSVRHSMMFAAGGAGEGISPVSPLGSSGENDGQRRHSRPMVYDQRLNPSVLFANAEANGSRVSMQDQQDYSRPLGVMNPDPRPSSDSRFSHA